MLLALRILVALLAVATLVCTIMPMVRTYGWWVRGFDFPRVQVVVAILVTLALFAAIMAFEGSAAWDDRGAPWGIAWLALPVLLLAALGVQLYRIYPYTPLADKEMEDALPGPHERSHEAPHTARLDQTPTLRYDPVIRLLIFNVRYDNHDAQALLDLVERVDPDAVLLAEPTNWWAKALEPLKATHPHAIEQPQENHYGMLFYSRLELVEPRVRYLVDQEVPSIHAGLKLDSGQVVTLYGVHPKPPGLKRPRDEERADSDERDAELLTIAREIRQARQAQFGDVSGFADQPEDGADGGPVIVAGDFNDVAWSHTTRLFRRVSGLLDPRIGRGLHNTYNAKSRIFRFPLDHVFASHHFRLVEMNIIDGIGSDHHPVLVALAPQPSAPRTQDKPQAQGDDMHEARQTIQRR